MYKLLIVEDEDILRNGLIATIDWTQLGFQIIGCGKDGIDGLSKALEMDVDVVLTDIRMPRMTGLEMSKKIKEKKPNIEIVLLSGYDEFTYAKQGMDIGVYNYIMKLNMFDEIDKVFKKLRVHLDNTNDDMVKINQLSNIKYRSNINSAIEGRSTGWLSRMTVMCAIVCFVKDKSAYKHNFEIMKDFIYGYTISGDRFVALCAARNMEETTMRSKCISIARGLSNVAINRDVVITDFVSGEEHLPMQIRKAHKLLDIAAQNSGRMPNILLSKKDLVSHIEKKSTVTYNDMSDQLDLKRYTNFLSLANTWMENAIVAEDIYYVDVQKMARRLLTKVQDNLHDINSDYVETIDKYLKTLDNNYSILKIKDDFKKLVMPALNTLQKVNFNQSGAAIEEAVKYINKNYDKQISTKEIADMINLSTPYFSSSFKRITGVNYSDYICRLRMDKACELLTTTKLKIYEVSHMVGYLDEKHFSKMFSKRYHMTPATYRKLNTKSE